MLNSTEIAKFLSLSPAARQLEISSAHLARLVREGKVRSIKTPLGRLFDPRELRRVRREREAARNMYG